MENEKIVFIEKMRDQFRDQYELTMENCNQSPGQIYQKWLEDQLFELSKDITGLIESLDAAGLS